MTQKKGLSLIAVFCVYIKFFDCEKEISKTLEFFESHSLLKRKKNMLMSECLLIKNLETRLDFLRRPKQILVRRGYSRNVSRTIRIRSETF